MREKIYKECVKVDGQDIKIELYYSKDNESTRGYYMLVVPVEIEDKGSYQLETVRAYTGVKQCLLEVKRKSKKSEDKAMILFEDKKSGLIEYVMCKIAA